MRQYYDGVTIEIDASLSLVEPWLRHRDRLATELRDLREDQWKATTRCAAWDAGGVVSHLITVDAFWVMSLRAAKKRKQPTTFIRGFDPATGTNEVIAPLLELPPEALLELLTTGTDAFVAAVGALEADDWDAPGEAPFGHMPARLLLAHALWDSWLHERDILQPLGLAPEVEPDEALAVTWYTLVVGALQGGLLDDPDPVGPGPFAPIDVTLRFEELLGDQLRVRIGSGVSIARRADADAVNAGSAVALVEHLTGRAPSPSWDALPADLAAQLVRAAQLF
jgi:uncharacterized protein (TIGR03083 family)